MPKPFAFSAKNCVECGDQFITCWPRQIRCQPCGLTRRNATANRGVVATRMSKSLALAEIELASAERKSAITRAFDAPEFEWIVTYKVKHSNDASKNRRWSNNGKGAVFLSESVRRYQDYLVLATQRAMQGTPVVQNKVWVSFHVQKPNHKSDAINVVDTLCDAIKKAVGIDDRWFCIGRLDWEIKRDDPEIFITIAQETRQDVIVCAHCGDIKGVENFTMHRGYPLGRNRTCRECSSVISKHRKRARASL